MSGISTGRADDLLQSAPDDVTHDVVWQRYGDREANSSLGQLKGCEPIAHGVHDPRTERKDAEVMFGGEKGEQGFLLVGKRGHPVTRALLGTGHYVQRQVADVLECGARSRVESCKVFVHNCHTQNDTQGCGWDVFTHSTRCGYGSKDELVRTRARQVGMTSAACLVRLAKPITSMDWDTHSPAAMRNSIVGTKIKRNSVGSVVPAGAAR